MIRIYLAAHFSRQAEMRARATRLSALGCIVTSRWLWEAGPSIPDGPRAARCAQDDLDDIDDADVLVLESESATRGSGRHVEFGYALAKGKDLVVLGQRESVFHHLPGVTILDDESALIDWLRTCPVDGSHEPAGMPEW